LDFFVVQLYTKWKVVDLLTILKITLIQINLEFEEYIIRLVLIYQLLFTQKLKMLHLKSIKCSIFIVF